MNLRDYINSVPAKDRTKLREALAKAAGVSESCIKHYANGRRQCPPARAEKIEKASKKKVTAIEIVFGKKK